MLWIDPEFCLAQPNDVCSPLFISNVSSIHPSRLGLFFLGLLFNILPGQRHYAATPRAAVHHLGTKKKGGWESLPADGAHTATTSGIKVREQKTKGVRGVRGRILHSIPSYAFQTRQRRHSRRYRPSIFVRAVLDTRHLLPNAAIANADSTVASSLLLLLLLLLLHLLRPPTALCTHKLRSHLGGLK